jgi:hypothetical protein
MKLLAAALATLVLSGCVVASDGVVTTTSAQVVYEPDVYVGDYYVGYYREGFGYWTGYGWDVHFYDYGHSGFHHYYRGAPRTYYRGYVGGSRYRSFHPEHGRGRYWDHR